MSVVINKDDFEKYGWVIKKEDIIKKSLIGTGKFGGKFISDEKSFIKLTFFRGVVRRV